MASEESNQEIIKKLSDNEIRLGESISALTLAHNSLEYRVRSLEDDKQNNAISRARDDERDKALYERLSRMEDEIKETREEIKGIKNLGGRVLWLVSCILITALVGWVIKGGLA